MQTETPTDAPTEAYNRPGIYTINLCTAVKPQGEMQNAASISFCITTVEVLDDRSMRFNVSWRFTINDWRKPFNKKSDADNRHISLLDDLGNYYPQREAGGCSAMDFNDDCNGWFRFDPAQPGAQSFVYSDTEKSIRIAGIVLINGRTKRPTRTGSPAATQTAGRTFTPTRSPDPNAAYNAPGTYWIYQCVPYPVTAGITGADRATLCLQIVVVNPDGTMKFVFTWTMYGDARVPITKQPDSNNQNIYLLDDLQNEYHYFQTGGCAAEYFQQWNEIATCNGWFLFPPAQPGAASFQFLNADLLVSIKDIVLLQ